MICHQEKPALYSVVVYSRIINLAFSYVSSASSINFHGRWAWYTVAHLPLSLHLPRRSVLGLSEPVGAGKQRRENLLHRDFETLILPADGMCSINTVEIGGAAPTQIIYFWDITEVYVCRSRNDTDLSTVTAEGNRRPKLLLLLQSSNDKADELYCLSSSIVVTPGTAASSPQSSCKFLMHCIVL